jgi:hypothetical protein
MLLQDKNRLDIRHRKTDLRAIGGALSWSFSRVGGTRGWSKGSCPVGSVLSAVHGPWCLDQNWGGVACPRFVRGLLPPPAAWARKGEDLTL